MSFQPPDFRCTLTDKYGNELVLKDPPEGWKDYGNQWTFKDEYFGYSRATTVPMRFVLEGADFLRRIASNEGVNGVCEVKIERLNRNTYEYFIDYVGGVDFSRTKNNRLFFEASITDKGTAQMLNAYARTKYEIDIDDNSKAVDIRTVEGMNFIEFVKYDAIRGEGWYCYRGGENAQYNNGNPFIHIDSKNTFIKSFEFIFNTNPNNNFLEKSKTDDEITINANILLEIIGITEVAPSGNVNFGTIDLLFEIAEKETNGTEIRKMESNVVSFNRQQITNNPIDIKFNISFNPRNEPSKYELRYKTQMNGGVGEDTDYILIGVDYSVTFEYNGTFQTKPFIFKAIPVVDFINETAKNTCKREDDMIVSLLDFVEPDFNEKYFITSADAIRGIEHAKGVISFEETFTSLDAMFFLAFQVRNEKIEITPKQWVFEKETRLLDVGKVTDLEFSVPEKWIFNRFKIGYGDRTYEEQNGRNEFNIGLEFESPVNTLQNNRNIISKIRADSFGIQEVRWKFVNNKSRDSSSDNDIFIVCARKINGEFFVDTTPITNIVRKGAFNVQLSPKRCMMRWFPYLASIYDKMINEDVKYCSSDKIDADLVSDFITEKEDVRVGDMGEKMFTPIIAEFKTGLRKNVTTLIGQSPRGYIEFTHKGITLKGFPIEMPQDSIRRGTQQWKVMMHPDTPINIEDMMFSKGWRNV